MNSDQLRSEIWTWLDLDISQSTIEKAMYERGFVHSKNQWKTHLEDHHKARRLAYCQVYQSVDWTNGVCTDEANIRLENGWKKVDPWPARSPDLNISEKGWDWCRQYISDHFEPARKRREL